VFFVEILVDFLIFLLTSCWLLVEYLELRLACLSFLYPKKKLFKTTLASISAAYQLNVVKQSYWFGI